MRKKIIIGNWKMNPPVLKEAEKLFSGIAKGISKAKKTARKNEVVICPPFIYLEPLHCLLKAKSYKLKANLGAQDAFWGEGGAFTGEISGDMLYNVGVRYVILGHSERRTLGEKNNDINKKLKASLAAGLRPILCVGESVRDENHSYFNFIKTQLEECLLGVSKNSISKVIIAYEPVWAISSAPNSKDATPGECLEIIIFIRKILSDKFGQDAMRAKIIYGGSVNEKNAGSFLKEGGADGLLVGQASLNAKKFAQIISIADNLEK